MKKAWLVSVFTFCFSLVVITGLLLAFPITASAATCTATCSSGVSVTCYGNAGCEAIDGVGCRGRDIGKDSVFTACPQS